MAGIMGAPSGAPSPANPLGDPPPQPPVMATMNAGIGITIPIREPDELGLNPSDSFAVNYGNIDDAPVWEPYPGERWQHT